MYEKRTEIKKKHKELLKTANINKFENFKDVDSGCIQSIIIDWRRRQ